MKVSSALVLSALALATPAAFAAPVPVTDWHTFKTAPATTLAGQGTDAPVFGSIDAGANNGFLVGYLPSSLSLVNVGDSITFSFKVTFNDATAVGTNGDNFRFALFDTNGQAKVTDDNYATAGVDGQTDDWRGYWFGHKGGGGAGANGSMRKRTAALESGDNVFAATGSNGPTVSSLGTVGGQAVTISGLVNGTGTAPLYTGVMTLTKTDAGTDLSGSFAGDNSPDSNLFAASDAAPPTSSFNAVAFLDGSGVSAEQLLFQDVSVTYTPAGAVHHAGDTNNDGVVDLTDLNNVLNNFGSTGTNPGDDNSDNVVDLTDLNNVLNNFGTTYAAAALNVVPEPASLSLLALGATALLTRRRRA